MLISAPTGSGKTLAAFTLCLDDLVRRAAAGPLPDETLVVYVSPLKALTNDVRENLEKPLGELLDAGDERGRRAGADPHRRAHRRHDAGAARSACCASRRTCWSRRRSRSSSCLTAEKSRALFAGVQDDHRRRNPRDGADKRGSHLALTLARLDDLVARERRAQSRSASASRRRCGRSRTSRDFLSRPRDDRRRRSPPRDGARGRGAERRTRPGREQRDVGRDLRPRRRADRARIARR